ncbi:ferredoxin [Rhodococcus sp. CH91]|uniref:ferredoxin n=1 Tax=Rhodococcus sp. CH91 TaxID=2910256 RepID=UPI001F4AB8D0|nr:ferredoxin [Rhodococcus sp. CH91]
MRIEADLDLCQGHAMCSMEAPDVFAVAKRGEVEILLDPVPDGMRPAVEDAVKYCPTQALRIVED